MDAGSPETDAQGFAVGVSTESADAEKTGTVIPDVNENSENKTTTHFTLLEDTTIPPLYSAWRCADIQLVTRYSTMDSNRTLMRLSQLYVLNEMVPRIFKRVFLPESLQANPPRTFAIASVSATLISTSSHQRWES